MESEEIERLTRSRFPEWETVESPTVDVIDRAGSGRRFFRLKNPGKAGPGLLAMHYTLDRRENGRFVAITHFLEEQGVPVPKILGEDEACQVLWQEDLGTRDLASSESEDWDAVRAPLYRRVLEAILPLHRVEESAIATPELEPPFDEALYRWEQDYFFDRFALPLSGASAEEVAKIRGSADLRDLAGRLCREPRRLLHRDFQSSNVMIREGEPVFIDYQGLRWGVPEYDLASLLYDPYVELTPNQREELARHYHGLRVESGDEESWERFRSRLDRCAAQRLMQALGAYGFLGLEKGQRAFLEYIPAAIVKLREVAVENGAAPALAPVLSLPETRVA